MFKRPMPRVARRAKLRRPVLAVVPPASSSVAYGWAEIGQSVARALKIGPEEPAEISSDGDKVIVRRVVAMRGTRSALHPSADDAPIADVAVAKHNEGAVDTTATAPNALHFDPVDLQELRAVPAILVVDDSAVVRKVAQRLMEREGWECVLASDGLDALGQLQHSTPSVMLVDIEMPRMDGLTFAREVRRTPHLTHVPIIVISSYTYDEYRETAQALGIDVYLSKPYDARELVSHVRRFIAAGAVQAV